MELTNELTMHLPPDAAWAVLADLPRMATLVPGARLVAVDGPVYKGEMRVRVGPLTATYKGELRFVERDPKARRAVLRAEGHDARQGPATATVTATLHPAVTGTRVLLATDLTVSGKVALFGRSVLADISVKLADQFAERLGTELGPEVVDAETAVAAVVAVPTPGSPPAVAAGTAAVDWAPPPPGATAVPWPAPEPEVDRKPPTGAADIALAAAVPAPSPVQANRRLAPVVVGTAVVALLVLRRLRR